jgi:hypothetical protein
METACPPVHQRRSPQPVPAAYVPPVSVDCEPWYTRLSGASVLPAPCFSPQASLYIGCPEVALMRAVLEDALACFQRQFETAPRWVQQEAREAEGWLFSDDAHGLFSYVYVCAVLGLEPESIRQELMRWSQSHPSTRQHSRATRRTQTDQAWQARSCRRTHRSTVRQSLSPR